MQHTKDDPALWQPEERDGFARRIAERRAVNAACTRSDANAAGLIVGAANLRRPFADVPFDELEEKWPSLAAALLRARAQDATVSLESLEAKYPAVAAICSASRLMLATLQGFTAEELRQRVAEMHGPSFDVATAALWQALSDDGAAC